MEADMYTGRQRKPAIAHPSGATVRRDGRPRFLPRLRSLLAPTTYAVEPVPSRTTRAPAPANGVRRLGLAAAILTAVGCTKAKGPGGFADACDLVPAGVLVEVLGAELAPTSERDHRGPGAASVSTCIISARNGASITVLVRRASAEEDPSSALARYMRDTTAQLGANHTLEHVTGLGDGGVWDPELRQLSVFRRGDMFTISVNSIQEATFREIAVRIAHAALTVTP